MILTTEDYHRLLAQKCLYETRCKELLALVKKDLEWFEVNDTGTRLHLERLVEHRRVIARAEEVQPAIIPEIERQQHETH